MRAIDLLFAFVSFIGGAYFLYVAAILLVASPFLQVCIFVAGVAAICQAIGLITRKSA